MKIEVKGSAGVKPEKRSPRRKNLAMSKKNIDSESFECNVG